MPGAQEQRYQSWGHYPKAKNFDVKSVFWQDETADLASIKTTVLPYGYGRSYGDTCMNEGGTLLDATALRRFIAFDEERGILRCEAGVMLADILEMVVPRGWFLPVTPGTKFISIGGAIANDVHGKNHHKVGTFGCHVTCFELLRSNGERLLCSPDQNIDMFRATIGGLGLTGLILWAEFKLRAVPGPFIAEEQIRFSGIDEFFEMTDDSDKDFEYTVSWVDCLATGKSLGRGLLARGNHDRLKPLPGKDPQVKSLINIPVNLPTILVNGLTLRALNTALFYQQIPKTARKVVHYNPFFYPLDIITNWNRGYGSSGFIQYQCVVPYNDNHKVFKAMLQQIAASAPETLPTLNVLKTFGNVQSPGMLSFPRPGVTLALDFPVRGRKTFDMLESLDAIVRDNCGAVYPAKDARMSAESFQAFFPRWREFSQYIDPKFSSNFWRRVTQESGRG